jgi:hypothetical protein
VAYSSHYLLVDDLILHLDQVVSNTADPFLASRYTGFVAVATVTVIELCVKEIFIEFAKLKHPAFGRFVAGFFDRINGRIRIANLKKDYVGKFGDRYLERFSKRLEELDIVSLRSRGVSVKQAYENLITWRNDFAHEGRLPTNATYAEVKQGYACAKEIIGCLAGAMVR